MTTETLNRTAPTALESERAILGCLMLDGAPAFAQCGRLRPEMLALDSHRRIYAAVASLMALDAPIDLITVTGRLRERRELDSVGGAGYVTHLSSGVPRHMDVSHHVAAVVEAWKSREGMKICEAYGAYFADGDPADDVLAAMQERILDALQENATEDSPEVSAHAIPVVDALLDYTQLSRGYSYGNAALDAFTDGMQAGEVTVVGARSGVGKSSLLAQVICANCSRGIAMDIFSLEMSREQLLTRIYAIVANLSYKAIQRRYLDADQRRRLRAAAEAVSTWPLRIYDNGETTLAQMTALIRIGARRQDAPTRIVGVDYAQIVVAEGKDDRSRVSLVSRTLTALTKALGTHLVLLSQLRKVEREHYSKPPHVGDLRETGQIENDAHAILLLHRGWDEETSKISYEAEIIIPKLRNGETGSMPAQFSSSTLTFDEVN